MIKNKAYRILPLIAFVILAILLFRGLYLEPQSIPSPIINQQTPTFSLKNLHNNQVITQTLFQDKWTVLNIWASWCEACSLEHSFLMKLNQQGVHLVGLNYKDEPKAAKSWLENYGNPYQLVLSDTKGEVAIDFGVYGSPETFLIDKQGIIRYRHVGILTPDVWQAHILPLISEKSA